MLGEVLGVERRRHWSDDDKLEILLEVGVGGASVTQVAQRHELTWSQIYGWRRDLKKKGLWSPDRGAVSHRRSRSVHGVYRRACGGATVREVRKGRRGGLSPRVRRSRMLTMRRSRPSGSIAARAAEPETVRSSLTYLTVYRRACGGANSGVVPWARVAGLSPRVRRSH